MKFNYVESNTPDSKMNPCDFTIFENTYKWKDILGNIHLTAITDYGQITATRNQLMLQIERNEFKEVLEQICGRRDGLCLPPHILAEKVLDKREMKIVANHYFKDCGNGLTFISGLPLPKDPDGATRYINFVTCSFHPESYGIFEGCQINGVDIPDGEGCLWDYDPQYNFVKDIINKRENNEG